MFKEFKEFALKGNAFNLAIGVIIGGAFQKIINSLVADVIMPCLSIFTGTVDYSKLTFTINKAQIAYGSFISAVINFLIIALSLFFVIKYISKLNAKIEKARLDTLNNKFVQEALNSKFIQKANELKKKQEKKRKKKEKPEPEPTTKLCPFCFSEINIKATRCPHCTGEIPVISTKSETNIISEQIEITETK